MNIFEHIYRSCHQLPYNDPTADSLWEHIYLCFKDPECLREMSNSRKRDTQLPMNIWLDDNQSYKKSGHYKRLKFQKDYGNKVNVYNHGSIDFNGNFIRTTMSGCRISIKDLKGLQTFVKNNQLLLDLICDLKISLKEFYELMIPGTESASEQELQTQKKEIDELLGRLEQD